MTSREKKPAKPRAGRKLSLSEFYSHCGMLVQDSTIGEVGNDSILDEARDRQLGLLEETLETPSSTSRSFTGTGRLLSGETVSTAALQQPEVFITHNIVFWTNGFTVNDGPLRRFDDPDNADFLESVRKSECPKELEPTVWRASVDLNLIRRDDKCKEPEKPKVPFLSIGRFLGGSSSSSSSEQPQPAAGATPPSNTTTLTVVDPALPTTSIQLRLAEGTRLVAHLSIQ